ncbi:MAG: phospholipid-binding protein MlaC [Paracoccaceae bacterium]
MYTIGSNYLYSESNTERLDPKNFVETIYKKINKVASKESNKLEKISDMLSLFDESVDVLFISRAVLGPSWKTSTKAERRHFSLALKYYMAKKYGKQFGDFNSGTLQIENVKSQGSKGYLIDSKIITENSKSFDISWQVVMHKTDLKLINIKFEGISMIHTERTEIGNLLRSLSGSVPTLIKELENY